MRLASILFAALSIAALAPVAASAHTYDWSFSNSSDNGNGSFTTATPWTPAGVAITDFAGEIDSNLISALSGYAGADNDLHSVFPFISQGGISLTTSLDTYNIANINNAGAPGLIKESVDPSGTSNGEPITLSISAVPESASWAMMLVGLGALGAVMRSRRSAIPVTI